MFDLGCDDGDFTLEVSKMISVKEGFGIEINSKTREVKIIRFPDRSDIGEPINEQLVVEFYSK